jgi:hypothetical protein
MSAAIRTDTYAETAATARPQVQSRRVSLKLGPLGLTYATDELLWDPAASADLSASAGASASAGTAASGQAAAWTEAGTPDFQRDLAAARRLEEAYQRAAQAAAETRTYGPAKGARQTAAETSGQSAAQNAGTTPSAPPTVRRRAIAAYTLCAAGAPASLLNAVA